jgi:hypothetical protein
MSRYFSMFVRISGANPDRTEAVQNAAAGEWSFDAWHESSGILTSGGDGQLGGGESDDEFSQRLAKAIWAANGGFCEVELHSTYLDDLPYESFNFDQNDYARLTAPS